MLSGADRDINGSALLPAKAAPAAEHRRPQRSAPVAGPGGAAVCDNDPASSIPFPTCGRPLEIWPYFVFFPIFRGSLLFPGPSIPQGGCLVDGPAGSRAAFGPVCLKCDATKITGVATAVVCASEAPLGWRGVPSPPASHIAGGEEEEGGWDGGTVLTGFGVTRRDPRLLEMDPRINAPPLVLFLGPNFRILMTFLTQKAGNCYPDVPRGVPASPPAPPPEKPLRPPEAGPRFVQGI